MHLRTVLIAAVSGIVFGMSAVPRANGEIVTKEVSYEGGGVTMKGILTWDDATDKKRPGVLVVHEWWGLNDYARERAKMLAELGYVAMAIDMFGDGKTADHPKEAGAFAAEARADLGAARERFEAALAELQKHPLCEAGKTAAIGYCFGGGVVLQAARDGIDLDAVASFHGSLGTPEPAKEGAVKARVLVCNGAADKFVTEDQIVAFQREMNDAGADFEFINYEGALHGFTNPGATDKGKEFDIPLAYDAKADAASWEAMKKLFGKVFGGE